MGRPSSNRGRVLKVTLVQIRVFVEVVERAGFAKAADALGMSQPSVSHAVASLEKAVGRPLFVRQPAVAPTPLGRKLLPHARSVLASFHSFSASALDPTSPSGDVRLAVTLTARTGMIPSLLPVWERAAPHVKVHVLEADEDEMVPWLEEGAIDAAILIDPSEIPPGGIVVARDAFAAVLRKDHPLAAEPSISVTDLLDDPVIVSASSCRPRVMEICTSAVPAFRPVQQVRDLSTLLRMVAGHVGVSVVPTLARSMLGDELVMVPLHPVSRRTLVLTGPSTRPWLPAVTALRDAIALQPLSF